MRMRPAWPGTIPPASEVSHPHVRVRTRTVTARTLGRCHAACVVPRLVLAAVLALVGVVWILQGLDVLGGSGMSGHIVWTVIGAILVAVAVALVIGARRLPEDR